LNSRKKTAVIECRIDVRILGSLNRYYRESGLLPSSRSELLRQSLTLLVESLSSQGKIPNWRSISNEEAMAELQEFTEITTNERRLTGLSQLITVQPTASINFAEIKNEKFNIEEDKLKAMSKVFELLRNKRHASFEEWNEFPLDGQTLLLREGLGPIKDKPSFKSEGVEA
jgi:hypothetical protein